MLTQTTGHWGKNCDVTESHCFSGCTLGLFGETQLLVFVALGAEPAPPFPPSKSNLNVCINVCHHKCMTLRLGMREITEFSYIFNHSFNVTQRKSRLF